MGQKKDGLSVNMKQHKGIRIAVTSRSFSRHPILRQELMARYPTGAITLNESGASLAGDALIHFLKGHDRAITALERLDDTVFGALPELKVISKYGVGLDMIDLDAMARRDVRLGWTGGVNRRSVAELVVAMMIALLRRIPEANKECQQGVWRQLVGRQLTKKTVGIIGCGHVGKDLVALLKGFDCDILAHDIRDYSEFYRAHHTRAVGIEELLTASDIVTLHLPLDESTRNILSAERLHLLKPTAILINAARGGLIDESEMKTMLKDGRLAGAGLDVLSHEPPGLAEQEFMGLPNVLITPHIGGSAEEAVLSMGRAAISGLESARVPTAGWPESRS